MTLPFRALGRRAPEGSFGILIYHRVCPTVNRWYPPTYHVVPEVFEHQLRWLLNQGYQAWPLQKLIAFHREKTPIPSKVFAVTFDDGYENNYTFAYPILKRLHIPATIFLATEFIDTARPFPFDNWSLDARHEKFPDAWKALNWEQCREMQESGLIEFGCHTHTHQDFRNDPAGLCDDIRKSMACLKERLNIEQPTFAFPYGTPDEGFSDVELAEAVKESGCKCALQVGNSIVHDTDDLFHWPRFDVASRDTGRSLAAKLDGWSQWARGWWRKVRTLPRSARSDSTVPSHSAGTSSNPALTWKQSLHRFLSNRSSMALIDQGIISGTSFITSLVVGRLVGKEGLGVLFITLGIFTFLQLVTDQLVHVPFLVRSPHFEASRIKKLIGSSLVHAGVITVIGVAILMVCALISYEQTTSPPTLPLAFGLLALLLPGMMLREFMHSMLHNQLRQAEAVRLDLAVATLQIGLLVLLIGVGQLTIAHTLLVLGGSAAVMALWRLPKFLGEVEIAFPLPAQDFTRNWEVGKWTLGSYLIGSSAPTVLPWFLAYFHGAESTGLLAACLTLFGIAQTFLRGVGKYMAPQMAVAFAKGGRESLVESIKHFTVFVTATITLIAITLAVGGEYLIQVAFGKDYSGVAPIMWLLAIGCWMQTFDVVAGNSLLAITRSDRNFHADCARFAATLVFAAWCIPQWGAWGVALSLVVGMLSGLLFRGWMLWIAIRDLPGRMDASDVPSCASLP